MQGLKLPQNEHLCQIDCESKTGRGIQVLTEMTEMDYRCEKIYNFSATTCSTKTSIINRHCESTNIQL